MLKLKVTKEEYEKLPEAIQAEYKQDGDDYNVQVDGMKTDTDVKNVQEALRKEREEHDTAKKRAKELEKENGTLSDKINVYESDESKKLSAEDRVEMERLKRENETLATSNADLTTKYQGLEGEVTTSNIKAELRKAAVGIISEQAISDQVDILANKFVVSDGKVLTNPDLGDKSGLEAKAYLSDYVKDRSYLQPTNSGGGAGGEKGSGGGSQKEVPGQCTASQDLWNGKATGGTP
jgi:hypothetical protein